MTCRYTIQTVTLPEEIKLFVLKTYHWSCCTICVNTMTSSLKNVSYGNTALLFCRSYRLQDWDHDEAQSPPGTVTLWTQRQGSHYAPSLWAASPHRPLSSSPESAHSMAHYVWNKRYVTAKFKITHEAVQSSGIWCHMVSQKFTLPPPSGWKSELVACSTYLWHET